MHGDRTTKEQRMSGIKRKHKVQDIIPPKGHSNSRGKALSKKIGRKFSEEHEGYKKSMDRYLKTEKFVSPTRK